MDQAVLDTSQTFSTAHRFVLIQDKKNLSKKCFRHIYSQLKICEKKNWVVIIKKRIVKGYISDVVITFSDEIYIAVIMIKLWLINELLKVQVAISFFVKFPINRYHRD